VSGSIQVELRYRYVDSSRVKRNLRPSTSTLAPPLPRRRGSEGLAPIPSDQTRRVPAGTGQPRERLVLAS
jgi:hypothetical protein